MTKRRNAHAVAASKRKAGPHENKRAHYDEEPEMYWDDLEEWERNELAQDNEGYGDWEDEGEHDEYE